MTQEARQAAHDLALALTAAVRASAPLDALERIILSHDAATLARAADLTRRYLADRDTPPDVDALCRIIRQELD